MTLWLVLPDKLQGRPQDQVRGKLQDRLLRDKLLRNKLLRKRAPSGALPARVGVCQPACRRACPSFPKAPASPCTPAGRSASPLPSHSACPRTSLKLLSRT